MAAARVVGDPETRSGRRVIAQTSRALALGLARLLLHAYPTRFRRELGDEYLRDAETHFDRAATRVGPAMAAVLFGVLIARDWMKSAPPLWLSDRGYRRQISPPRSTLMQHLADAGRHVMLAGRSLMRRPGLSLLVVLTLALGVGTSTAMFRLLDRIVLRPLPYRDGDRMVYLALKDLSRGWQFSPTQALVDRWRERSTTLERVEVYRNASVTRTGDGQAEILSVVDISGGLPGMLGVVPLAGRLLGPVDADPASPPAVMLAEPYWKRAFGGDRGVVGRAITLNDTLYTIAGIWPAAARLDYRGMPAVFRTMKANDEARRGDFSLVLALARPRATTADIEHELRMLSDSGDDTRDNVAPTVNAPYGFIRDGYVRGLWTAFAGGLVLLVVALVNAANLMLGRVSARIVEIGVRLALGATLLRVGRMLLAESVLLCGTGLVMATAVSLSLDRVLESFRPAGIAPATGGVLDMRTVAFAVGLAAVGVLACTLMPLGWVRRVDVRDLVGRGGERRGGDLGLGRAVLLGVQTAFAVILACSAALLSRSFLELSRVDTGTEIERLATVAVSPPTRRFPTPELKSAFLQRVRSQLEALPGVRGVVTQSAPLFQFSVREGSAYLEGESLPDATTGAFTSSNGAEPDYFRVLGIPVLEGRPFEAADIGSKNVIVNEAFRRQHGGDVLGRVLRFTSDSLRRVIVGVVGNVTAHGLTDAGDRIQVYSPDRMGPGYASFVLRVEGDPEAAVVAARRAIAMIDPDVPLAFSTTGREMLRRQTAESRFLAMLLAVFASFGLLFAIGGIFGAMSLDVIRRRREIGIRLAVGATGRDVIRDVLWRCLRPVLAGGAAGLALAVWGSTAIESLLFRTSPRDPLSAVASVGALVLAAAAGSALPAWRASRVDPSTSLQAE